MPWYTGLARVAKNTGYPVVEVAGWKTRGHGPMAGCKTIVVHHTAGSSKGNFPSLNVVKNGRAGLPGPLSQYGLGRDGTIYVIAAGRSWHTGNTWNTSQGNSFAIGIEAENTGVGETWSDAQLDAYVKLCAELIKEFKLPVSAVQGHKEIAKPKGRKIDPAGIDMDDFRTAVSRGYWISDEPVKPVETKPAASKPAASKPAVSKPSAPKPSPKKEAAHVTVARKKTSFPSKAVKVTSKHTTDSHNAYIVMLGVIGFDHTDLTRNIQNWLQWNGYYQKSDGFIVDGKWGKLTTQELQKFLKAKGFYKGVIDGDRGPVTVKSEISYINSQAKNYR